MPLTFARLLIESGNPPREVCMRRGPEVEELTPDAMESLGADGA